MDIRQAALVLGLSGEITPEQVTAAYRKKAKQFHPDAPGGDTEAMKTINEAYGALKGFQGLIPGNRENERFDVEFWAAIEELADTLAEAFDEVEDADFEDWSEGDDVACGVGTIIGIGNVINIFGG